MFIFTGAPPYLLRGFNNSGQTIVRRIAYGHGCPCVKGKPRWPASVATTDTSFQKTYEYLVILLTLGLRDYVFTVLGNSRSSLEWVLKGRTRLTLCRRARIGFYV